MGPLIPSITLTDPNGITRTLIDNNPPCPGWDGVPGTEGRAITSRGRVVDVWKPDPNNSISLKYFCHGHTLGTYREYGYSVFSGQHVLTALEDDYNEIGIGQTPNNALNLVIPGDIISFSDTDRVVLHTALVVNVPMINGNPSGKNNRGNVTVWTKNGQIPECVQKLSATCQVYKNSLNLRYWRSK